MGKTDLCNSVVNLGRGGIYMVEEIRRNAYDKHLPCLNDQSQLGPGRYHTYADVLGGPASLGNCFSTPIRDLSLNELCNTLDILETPYGSCSLDVL